MAPVELNHNDLEQQLKDIIQDLYQVMVQVSTYDSTGRPSREVLANEIKNLSRDLQTVYATSSGPPSRLPSVPPELLEYVENGRNPDIYTREFVELVRRGNQLMRGKVHAFGSFRDILAADMAAAMPELRDDVRAVCEATGGADPAPDVVGAPVGNTSTEANGGTAEAASAETATPAAPAADGGATPATTGAQ